MKEASFQFNCLIVNRRRHYGSIYRSSCIVFRECFNVALGFVLCVLSARNLCLKTKEVRSRLGKEPKTSCTVSARSCYSATGAPYIYLFIIFIILSPPPATAESTRIMPRNEQQ